MSLLKDLMIYTLHKLCSSGQMKNNERGEARIGKKKKHRGVLIKKT